MIQLLDGVPRRLVQAIEQHLVLNFIKETAQPTLLGVFGPPGSGKTFGVRRTLQAHGVLVHEVDATDLESGTAGQPATRLRGKLVTAEHDISKGRPAALVIDDIDTTLGEWEQNTGTVNHQQLLALLMHTVDKAALEPERTRVPVIFTGNDASKLYEPLRRAGRMAHLQWVPTAEERREIVQYIMRGQASRATVDRLERRYGHQPLSFYAALLGQVQAKAAGELVQLAARDLSDVAAHPKRYKAYYEASTAQTVGSTSALEALAAEFAQALDGQHRSHLRSLRSPKRASRVKRPGRQG